MKAPLFTQPDTWTGGYIEAAILLADENSPFEQLINSVWSSDELEGPYPSREEEPENQSIVDLKQMADPDAMLYGILSLEDHTQLPLLYQSFEDEHGVWVSLNVPVGSLPRGWGLQGYPFIAVTPLYKALRTVVGHISKEVAARGAIIGWLTALEYDSLARIINGNPVPDERWHAYLLLQPPLGYFLPNSPRPFLSSAHRGE